MMSLPYPNIEHTPTKSTHDWCAVKEGTREIDEVDEQGDKGGGESDN